LNFSHTTQGILCSHPIFILIYFNPQSVSLLTKFTKTKHSTKPNEFIDAQTTFAKMMAKNYIELSKYSVDTMGKVFFPQKDSK